MISKGLDSGESERVWLAMEIDAQQAEAVARMLGRLDVCHQVVINPAFETSDVAPLIVRKNAELFNPSMVTWLKPTPHQEVAVVTERNLNEYAISNEMDMEVAQDLATIFKNYKGSRGLQHVWGLDDCLYVDNQSEALGIRADKVSEILEMIQIGEFDSANYFRKHYLAVNERPVERFLNSFCADLLIDSPKTV